MSGDAVSKLALLVTTVVAARAMSPVGFGRYIGLWATSVVASALWDAGVSTLVTREVAARASGVRPALLAAARLRIVTLVVWAAVFTVGAVVIGGGFRADIAFAAASLAFGVNTLLLSAIRGESRFRAAGTAPAPGRLFAAVLAACIVPNVGQQHALPLLGVLAFVGEGVTIGVCVALLRRHPPVSMDGRAALTLRRSLPFAANTLLSTIYNRLDVIIVPALAGAGQLARYAPASRIQDVLYLIPTALGYAALPMLARAARNRADVDRLTRQLVAFGLWVGIPVAVAAFVLSRWILTTVLGGSYAGAVMATRILVWFLPLALIQAPLFAALISVGRALDTTRIIAATFAVAITMHLILDPKWGATGGAIASLSRDIVATPLALWAARRAGLLGRRAPANATDVGTLSPQEASLT